MGYRMQAENIAEYQILREEMGTVKDCITKYIGYVLGGAGAAIYGMASMDTIPLNDIEIVITSLSLSAILNFILLILYYKFYSHNRFAGYCKLLNHERYEIQKKGTSFLSWEMVLERLRFSDISPKSLLDLVKNIEVKELEKPNLTHLLSKHTDRNPASDNAKFKKGCKILVQAILGKIETRSWGFPPIVVALFCILSCSFFIFGHIIFWHSFEISKFISDTYFFIALCFFLLILSILQFLLWYKFIGKLFSLMNGSSTVDGFFWRFLPVRIAFLNTYGIVPEYLFVNERLLEAIEELDET